jgi:cation diffusion facilitator CzcD-associated flavoprotein CzcO
MSLIPILELSFEPSPDWSEYYPKGAEIQAYYERIIEKHGLKDRVKLKHQVLKANWLSEAAQWAVEVQDLANNTVFVDTAHFLVNCQGRISEPKYPDIPGLYGVFKGRLLHTARWPSDVDLAGKRIAIIGNGASGQQLVPNVAPTVDHIDHYVRTKTWVTPTFVKDLHQATADAPGGPEYSDEQRESFRNDPAALLEHRRELEAKFHFPLGGDKLGSPQNAALREKIIETMRERLDGDEEWLQRVLPDYAPGCKRLTPAPGYLETLKSDKVDYVTSGVREVTSDGIIANDGTRRKVDVVILATGFKSGFTTRFPVFGKVPGLDLRSKWAPEGPIGYPESYLGVMAPGFPNYFFVLQAQGNARGGSVPLQTEITAAYIAKAIRKIQSQSYVSLDPREEAAQEFNDINGAFFEGSVISDNCNSWFKQKHVLKEGKTGLPSDLVNRVVIAWPGTYHHRAEALRDPRWEDFIFERRRGGAQKNRFEYFGDGSTAREGGGDPAELISYVRTAGDIDLAVLHENWNE